MLRLHTPGGLSLVLYRTKSEVFVDATVRTGMARLHSSFSSGIFRLLLFWVRVIWPDDLLTVQKH